MPQWRHAPCQECDPQTSRLLISGHCIFDQNGAEVKKRPKRASGRADMAIFEIVSQLVPEAVKQHKSLQTWTPGRSPLSTVPQVTVAVASYLSLLWLGQQIMANRKPLKLKGLFMLHNTILTVGSFIVFVLMAEEVAPIIRQGGLFHAYCSPAGWTSRLETLYIINYVFKYVEFIDTLFLVAKKKPLQFLHVFHHSATAVLCYTQLEGRTSPSWVVISINLLIHTFMYYYYLASTAGFKIWWKKYLTMGVVDLFIVYYGTYNHFATTYAPKALPSQGDCNGAESAALFGCGLLTSYLFLFIAFYRQTYKKSAKGGRARYARTDHFVEPSTLTMLPVLTELHPLRQDKLPRIAKAQTLRRLPTAMVTARPRPRSANRLPAALARAKRRSTLSNKHARGLLVTRSCHLYRPFLRRVLGQPRALQRNHVDSHVDSRDDVVVPSDVVLMDSLHEALERKDWGLALATAANLGLDADWILQRRWLSSSPQTTAEVNDLLRNVRDKIWVAAACLDAENASSVEVQRAIISAGLEATTSSAQAHDGLRGLFTPAYAANAPLLTVDGLLTLFAASPEAHRTCLLRKNLCELSYDFETFALLSHARRSEDEPEIELDEDPWAADEDPAERTTQAQAKPSTLTLGARLAAFLEQPLLQVAYQAAAAGNAIDLRILIERHFDVLSTHLLDLVDCLPEYADPSAYADMLRPDALSLTVRPSDWSSHPTLASALARLDNVPSPKIASARALPSAEALSEWYRRRAERIDSTYGLTDIALSLVQHGASQGVAELDALGEELSLLSKLVYDRPPVSRTARATEAPWTLLTWRAASDEQILRTYLARSTPETIAVDIRRLALPFLYVLESRYERQGKADSQLPQRMLRDYILSVSESRLDLFAAVVQASKPTLPDAQRIIKSDDALARLALAALYANKSLESWDTMSKVFECMPAFEDATDPNATGPNAVFYALQAVNEAISTKQGPAQSLYNQLAAVNRTELSRALDHLDVHLLSAEIFAKWSVPTNLAWFLNTQDNKAAQQAYATKMARQAAGPIEEGGAQFDSEDEWVGLMDDMVQLTRPGESGASGPFHLLTKDEILRTFFSGLLAAGKFTLARSLLNPSTGERPLGLETERELVLLASRELYDTSDTLNMHKGNMQLAYECLTVCQPSPEIRREREFIEATSRLASFKSSSSLSPIEVRMYDDKLALLERLLASNEDAYRHPDVLLDLALKLGYRHDKLAEVRVLSMLAQSALKSHDWPKAAELSDRMVEAVASMRRVSAQAQLAEEAAKFAWQSCYQLGANPEYRDCVRRSKLLGSSLLLCPVDRIPEMLTYWRKVEQEVFASSARKGKDPATPGTALFSQSVTAMQAQSAQLSSEAAARAARSLGRAATSYLPFRNSPSHERTSSGDHRQPELGAERLKNALTGGIGWLIGADDEHGRR
ncbi:uncharacterized protein L969DRAFT_96267 [Mixia osmundae IAM 14324]|uniref:uncharacterized protein n=1 Tax=Mixia osmundae (strain CBS 9802 / IAM 14324 / JCM 22182 / KY 12970) TaxID=764103 RepID=UPI0004A55480|nr:uncharacterized protein L969DRAFT_96267 [Mixia osmundae IAM 14324]KEI37749.1 hypothetical protein L969DRAFT_96267 [Mixia osmundae IAM 14324]